MQQVQLPQRVAQHLTLQKLGQETLVYDEARHVAFCLDAVASTVWDRCDGRHSIAQIASAATLELLRPVSEDMVGAALAQLQADGLMRSDESKVAQQNFAQLGVASRRNLIAQLGAGAVLLLPVVAMISTPTAAQAYNGCADCTPNLKRAQQTAAAKSQPYQAAPAKKPENPFIVTGN